MMYTKRCPKCGSTDIVIVDGYVGAYGSGNNIVTGALKQPALVDRFICVNCGYCEEWLRRTELNKLADSNKWHR